MCCINKIIFYCKSISRNQPTHHIRSCSSSSYVQKMAPKRVFKTWSTFFFFFFLNPAWQRVTSVSVFESRDQWCKLHACLSRPVTLRSSNSQTSLSQPVYFSSPIMHVNCLLCYLIPHDQINCRILAKKVAFNPCKLAALQQHIQS